MHGSRTLQPPHAHPKRAGKPGRATCHASTTHGSTFRVEAERIALADTAGSFISDEQLKRDITHWRKADTVETVIEDHHARHREMALMKNAQRDSSQTTRGLILCAKSLPKAAISTPRPILCAQGDDPLRHPRPLYPTTKSRGNLLALKCPLGWCHRYEILPLVHTRQQSRYDW
jgi:hypothetical protein